MTFQQLQFRLLEHLRARIRSGEVTERGLARLCGVSQPHFHNVLKGKRIFSTEMADEILHNLNIDVLDLMDEADLQAIALRRPGENLPISPHGKYSD